MSKLIGIALCGAIVVLGAGSKPARAMGIGPYATCGTMCMASYGPAMGPFMGMPMFPMTPGYGGYQTGQWGSPMQQDPRTAMAMYYNWNGTQPLGLSYMPPIGMSAISNSLSYGAYF